MKKNTKVLRRRIFSYEKYFPPLFYILRQITDIEIITALMKIHSLPLSLSLMLFFTRAISQIFRIRPPRVCSRGETIFTKILSRESGSGRSFIQCSDETPFRISMIRAIACRPLTLPIDLCGFIRASSTFLVYATCVYVCKSTRATLMREYTVTRPEPPAVSAALL